MGHHVLPGRPSGPIRGRAVARFIILAFIGCVTVVGFSTTAAGEFRINLDPGFSAWLSETKQLSYRELAHRFVAAGGRNAADYDSRMSALARAFLAHAEKQGNPTDVKKRIELLSGYIFKERGFRADLDLQNTDNLFPDSILSRKQGFCLGLSLLLADLGERIGWPLEVASAPRHTFVRYGGGNADDSFNIETTLGGQLHDDDWYRTRYELTGDRASLLKKLTPRETAAHLINNYGFTLLQRGFLIPARQELAGSLRLSGEVVETRINLGVLEARSDQFAAAIQHFDAALLAWPRDSYLLLNCVNAHLAVKDTLGAAVRAIELAQTGATPAGLDAARAELARRLLDQVDEGKNWRLLQLLVTTENAGTAKREGRKAGLLGTYFKDQNLTERAFSRVDRDISFRWSWDSPGESVPRDHFSVRWEGWFEAPRADEYGLFITCSDGIRVWIDGRLVVDSWRQANDSFPRGKVQLDPGLHDIKIEYFEAIGEAGISVIVTAKKEERPLNLTKHLLHSAVK